ncbi:hypothetical protein B0H14DRAFT_3771336 [Mycena olivaceomarginata]|nr:hypothetical protein B0H14DRAFT_3771336 [Mycena olivaceomarginata]
MTREQATCLLIPRSKPAQKKNLSDVLSSPLPIIIPPSNGGPRFSIRCIPRFAYSYSSIIISRSTNGPPPSIRRIPQGYRVIKPPQDFDRRHFSVHVGLRFVDPQEFSGTKMFNNGCGPQNYKSTRNESATGQIWNGILQRFSSNPPFRPRFHVSLFSLISSSSGRHRVELLLGLPASSEIRAMSTQLEDSAQPIFDAAGIAQPVRLPLLPFLDEVASRLLTLPIVRLFAASCHHPLALQSERVRVSGHPVFVQSFVDGCLIILR